MPTPDLIHPIPVTITPLNRTALIMDENAREPMHGSRAGTPFTVNAQIRWRDAYMPVPMATGVREEFDGYILVRTADLTALGQTIERGDQITRMGNMLDLDVFVIDSEPTGHWPDQGGHTLMRYYFESRRPGYQR